MKSFPRQRNHHVVGTGIVGSDNSHHRQISPPA
jgi:hypothetical protein